MKRILRLSFMFLGMVLIMQTGILPIEANAGITGVTIGAQSGTLTAGVSSQVTYSIAISYNSSSCYSCYSIDLTQTSYTPAAPTGVTRSWGPAFTNNNGIGSILLNNATGYTSYGNGILTGCNLTLYTSTLTPPGTYTFRVQVTGYLTAPFQDYTSSDVTLVVTSPCTNPTSGGTIAAAQTICYNTTPNPLTSSALPSGHTGTLEYKWQKSTTSSSSGFAGIDGASNTGYSPGALTQTTWFKRLSKVTCDGTWPASGESNVVEITQRPEFTAGAIFTSGQTICYNSFPNNIGSETSASGGDNDITYSWRSSGDNYSAAISGATGSTYTPAISLTTTTSYRRYAKDGSCNTTPTVSTGTWTVTVRAQFTSGEVASTGETICYNTSPSTAIGNTTLASGGDNTITYSWRSSADSYGTAISGATGSTYTPAGPLTTTTSYRRYAKDGTCNTTPTVSTGTWTVTIRPQFTTGEIAATGQTICYNTSPTTAIGNTTSASGGDNTITYSWRSSADSYATAISGATGSTYTPAGPLTTTTSYRRYAQDGTCNTTPTVSTGTWTVTVRPQFTSGAIATTGETICYNGNPALIGSTTAASGGDNAIAYQWQEQPAETDAPPTWTDITGATGVSYDPPGIGAVISRVYRRLAKDGTCNTTFTPSTGTWTVTVRPAFTTGAINTTGETICYNTSPTTTIGNTTSASGGDNTITYSWRSSADSYGTAISGATGSTYTPAGPLTTTTSYRRYAKDGTCNTTPTVSTGTLTVTVRPDFTTGAINTTGETICYNGNPALIGSATAASGGDNSISYQWQEQPADSDTPITWTDITGATGVTYDPPGIGAVISRVYRRLAKDGTCNTTFTPSTGTWTVTVRPAFATGAINTTGETICYNGNPAQIGSTTAASGGDNVIGYQWQSSTTSGITGFSDIGSATGTTYDPPTGLTETTWYRRMAKDGTCNTTFTASTGVWQVTVLPNFTAGAINTTGETICYKGDPAMIGSTTSANGGDGTITYQWQSSIISDSDGFADIEWATAESYDPPSGLIIDTWYRRLSKDETCNTTFEESAGVWKVSVYEEFTSGVIGIDDEKYPVTGQVTSYTNGDDGEQQFGKNYPVPRFTNNKNGTITDNLTGLIWLQKANCALNEIWEDALTLVEELNTNGTMYGNGCGDMSNGGSHQTDWRLPNRNEIESLINLEFGNNAAWLNDQGFINVTATSRYWSSTTVADDITHAWHFQVEEGRIRHWAKDVNSAVWAVRGTTTGAPVELAKTGQIVKYADGDDGDLQTGIAIPSPRFTDHGDGTVTDNLTNLIWLKNANCAGDEVTWENAFTWISELNTSGTINGVESNDTSYYGDHQTDWRLPNRKELISLLDMSVYLPSLTSGHPFENVSNQWYWTSSTYETLNNRAWEISLGSGSISHTHKTDMVYLWPVRTVTSSLNQEMICNGEDPVEILSNLPAAGGNESIYYKWQSSTDNFDTDIQDISNSDSPTFNPPPGLTETTWYRRMAKDGTCNTTFTASAGVWQVKVRAIFTTGAINTTGETICYNGDPVLIGSTTAASGGDNVISYQWQEQPVDADDPDPWNNITGATDATYDPPTGLTASTKYRRQAKDGTCNTTFTASSGEWIVTVRPEFTTGAIAITGENICYNTNPATTIGNTTSGSGGDNAIVYSWRSSADSYATEISGATGSTYVPAGPLTTTTSYRRYVNEGTCNSTPTVSTGTWTITVSPLSAGGAVTGGTDVCYGTNSTLLTLSGQTGAVLKWQYSTDNTNWSDISSHTQTTYTAENLTVDTWYRAVVESSPCSAVNSDATQITIITGMSISGYAKYENNPKSPLNGLKITLKKDGSPFGTPVTTGNNGYYEFTGLEQGNYGIEVASAHPSGLWQTWGGVNNTDYLLVSKHIAGTQYLPVNPPVVQITASTKLPHPTINNLDATAIRQAAKYPTTGYSYFDIPKWVFSGMNAANALDDITVVCSDVVRDIRGLCAGDVNGTYVPVSGYKTVDPGLELVHRGTLPLTDEIVFPIRVDRDMELGAITLYLDFDPSLITVTNVTGLTEKKADSELWFNISEPPVTLNPSTLNTLQIGWMSMEPLTVTEGQAVILIHAQMRGPVETLHAASIPLANPIRFKLNENPDSEFADAEGNVIDGLKLSIPDAGNTDGTVETLGRASQTMAITVYPNPAQSALNLEIETHNPKFGTLTLEMVNLHGVVVIKSEPETISAGWHKHQLDVRGIAPGVYYLRAVLNGEMLIKKVLIAR